MATITPQLNTAYASKDGTYQLHIRIHHNGKRRLIPVGFKLKEDQFKDGKIINHNNAKALNSRLAAKVADINKYIADCELHGKPIRIDLIGSGHDSYSFTDYLEHRAKQYHASSKIVMDRKLRRFAKELRACFGRDVHFSDITDDSLRTLDAHLIAQGNCNNTRHKKYKFLGEYFAHAVNEGKASGRNPFKFYKIPKDPVQKEKLTLQEISKLEQADLTGAVNDARNLFLFSYYTKGSRFASCITLHNKQIKGGRVHIQMDKGGKFVSVKIHPRLQGILDQYSKKGLVFPFLREIPADPEAYLKAIDSQNVIVNRNLKVVAAACEIEKNLTMHVARHSFAQHLKESSTSIHIIKEALGHSDTRTTEIYLRSLGDEVLDSEMEKVYGR